MASYEKRDGKKVLVCKTLSQVEAAEKEQKAKTSTTKSTGTNEQKGKSNVTS